MRWNGGLAYIKSIACKALYCAVRDRVPYGLGVARLYQIASCTQCIQKESVPWGWIIRVICSWILSHEQQMPAQKPVAFVRSCQYDSSCIDSKDGITDTKSFLVNNQAGFKSEIFHITWMGLMPVASETLEVKRMFCSHEVPILQLIATPRGGKMRSTCHQNVRSTWGDSLISTQHHFFFIENSIVLNLWIQ